MGDRAGGGNEPLYVLTNCDYVDAFVNGDLHGRFYPASNEFPNLPHPPVRLTGFPLGWAAAQKDLKLVGYVNDQAVAEQNFSAERLPRKLVAYVEDQQIYADGADMTRLQFKITDDYGNRLPYAIQPVTIELLEGDAELIGDNPFPLVGGQAAIFIKAHRTTGTVRVRLSSFRLADAEVSLEIVAP
jgi:beta-galactosidase